MADFEKPLLGCYLQGAPIGPSITADAFQSERHRAIFSAIRNIAGEGLHPDLLILEGELSRNGLLDAAGGIDYVASLTSGAYAGNAAYYEAGVLEAYKRRQGLQAAAELKEALESPQAPDAAIAAAAAKLSMAAAPAQAEPGMLFSDLLKKQFPPDVWYVENLIGPGLTVLTGASKIGKSWTALQLVTAIDQGGYFMGTLKAAKTDVLYMALEDTPRRIQKRLQKQGIGADFNGSRLETSRCSVAALRAFLKANPQYRIVLIDTFQRFMGITDVNAYAETVTAVSALKAIADDLGIAILVIHHNRKGGDGDTDHMESALGSTGIVATADCTLNMRRKRGASEATLTVTGRDVEDASYSLAWDRELCTWAITGQGALKPALPEAQQQILDLLESEERSFTTAEIAEITGIKKYEVSRQAKELAERGHIKKPSYGLWCSKNQFASLHPPKETQTCKLENKSSLSTETVPAATTEGGA